MQAFLDLPASGGHLALKATFDRVRDRYWWPTMQDAIESYCTSRDACQRWKTPHRRPPLPTGHVPVSDHFNELLSILWNIKQFHKVANMFCQ